MFRYLLGFSVGSVTLFFTNKLIDNGCSLFIALCFAAVLAFLGACFNAWTIKYFGN
jgi:hypothetical protein